MKENKMNYRSAYCSITEPSQFLRGNGLKIFFTFLLVLSIQFASAQIKVTGNVTDNNGIPLIGVNVVIIGTDQGTITNVKGNYSLNAAADAQLKFNYVGYNEVSLNVNGRTVINVQMAESTKILRKL